MSTKHLAYEFAGFRLDTRAQTLIALADGATRVLKPKLFDTLCYFLEHAGELLDKDTLLQALWPRQVVEENNLTQYVSALRRLLGEHPGGPRFIMTVRARGYRFLPEVLKLEAVTHNSGKPAAAPCPASPAWQCYRQALHLHHADQPQHWATALEVLRRALALDPGLAPAQALLCLTRVRLQLLEHPAAGATVPELLATARRARVLAPLASSSHTALGAVQALQGDWVGAELGFQTAADLDPEALLPLHLHSTLVLLGSGHLGRALDTSRRVMADVQGSSSMALQHAFTALVCDEDAEAHKALTLARAMGADMQQGIGVEVQALLALRGGDVRVAEALWRSCLPTCFVAAGGELALVQLCAAQADPLRATAALRRLEGCLARLDRSALPLAFCKQLLLWLVLLRALDTAYDLLEALLDTLQGQGSAGLPWGLLWLAELRPLREDPRFNRFLARLGLPAYWQVFGPPDGCRWVEGRLLPNKVFRPVSQRAVAAAFALQ